MKKTLLPSLEQCILVHKSHLERLKNLIIELGRKNDTEGDFKELLTTGYIALSALLGDYRVLGAMQQNLKVAVHFYSKAYQKRFSGNIQLLLKQQLGQTRRNVM